MDGSSSKMRNHCMKRITLNTSEQMLFALLRSSLHEREVETNFFQNVSERDWKQCYHLAIEQGVMALAWDGVMRLPKVLQPIRKQKLTWAMAVERYEAKYLRHCQIADELSALYASHGIEMVQLKGVGFSTLYPVPSHREGGDIDIYTYSSDKNKMSDQEANTLADTLMLEQGIEVDFHSYKHSNFYYKGVPIENHKCFLNVKPVKEALLLNDILMRELNPETVELVKGKLKVPSPSFNALFIAFHALQHYGNGLSLHHLCDWAVIMKHYGWLVPEEVKDQRFVKGIKALNCLCNEYLGTDVPTKGGETLANEMIQEILNPLYKEVIPPMSKLNVIIYKIRRLNHYFKLQSRVYTFTSKSRIWGSIKSHIRNPKTIFERKRK